MMALLLLSITGARAGDHVVRRRGTPYLDRIVILDTVEEVLRREAADLPAPASEILTELQQKGLLRAKACT